MKLQSLLLAAGVIVLASCQDDDMAGVATTTGNRSVTFSTGSLSRAAQTDNVTIREGFSVFAYLGNTPDFMYDQRVEYTDGAWTYTPVKYWPNSADAELSFYAYAPVDKPSIEVLTGPSDSGDPKVRYDANNKQADLCYASAVGLTNTTQEVSLTFHHALSCIGFRAMATVDGLEVQSVRIESNSASSATLNLATGEWSDHAYDGYSYTLTSDDFAVSAIGEEVVQLTGADAYQMVIPDREGAGNHFLVSVESTINGAANNVSAEFDLDLLQSQCYNFVLKISKGGLVVGIEIDDWISPEIPLTAYQEDLHVAGTAMPGSRINSMKDAAGTNVLKNPIGVADDGMLYIPFSQLDIEKMTSGTEYSLSVTDADGETKVLTVPFSFDYMQWTLSVSSGSTFCWPLNFAETGFALASLWGDGYITDDSHTLSLDNMSHTYTSAGTKVVRLYTSQSDTSKKQIPRLSFNVYPENSPAGSTAAKLLKSVDTPLLRTTSFTSGLFQNCTALTTVTEDCFAKNPHITSISYGFYNCTALKEIPSGLLEPMTKLNSLNFVFAYCTSLKSIPSGLFDKQTAATSMPALFYQCSGLTAIPEGLLDNNTRATNLNSLFAQCTGLTSIPAALFAKNTAATLFSGTFSGCTGITSIPSSLFANCTAATTFTSSFNGCTGISTIPSYLFRYNTKAKDFTGVFQNCTKLTAIPSALFSYCTEATNFSSAFKGCTSLKTVPTIFSANTAATTFAATFKECSQLASIPSTLFANNTNVTSFSETFRDCTALTSIPSALFANNTLVTSFGHTFSSTGITTIPAALFANCPAVTTFSSCFAMCTSLKTAPAGLFAKNTAAYDFSDTFVGDVNLYDFENIFISDASEKATRFAGLTQQLKVTEIFCRVGTSASNASSYNGVNFNEYTIPYGLYYTFAPYYGAAAFKNYSAIQEFY